MSVLGNKRDIIFCNIFSSEICTAANGVCSYMATEGPCLEDGLILRIKPILLVEGYSQCCHLTWVSQAPLTGDTSLEFSQSFPSARQGWWCNITPCPEPQMRLKRAPGPVLHPEQHMAAQSPVEASWHLFCGSISGHL